MILAGDIGGTKCNLALFERRGGKLHIVERKRFASENFARAEDVVAEIARPVRGQISAAAFGVAGPVTGNRVKVTNLSWVVDAAALAETLGLARVVLLNDLEAAAHGVAELSPSDLVPLNPGAPVFEANRALIAAGTGLGEAILVWDGARHVPSATEGGHADFAPHSAEAIELLRFLRKKIGHVSVEHVLSGRGFAFIHEFLEPTVRHASFDDPAADPAPEITELARAAACPVCVRTLDLWVAIYGAEAGNLALRALARGGVYVVGGIALKILDKLKDDAFVRAFCDKAQHRDLLAQIPISVVMNEDLPLLGAAACAAPEM